ncbi:hypothetical protein J6590_105773, partial [Homalodisca vitripennis]
MASANIDECPIMNHESDSDETKSSKSVGVSFYTVLQILESLFLVGMNSLENWEVVINGLKLDTNVVSDPNIMQIYYCLYELYNTFSSYIMLNGEMNEDKLLLQKSEVKKFDDIKQILKSSLNKKTLKQKTFSFDCVQKLLIIVKSLFDKDNSIKTPEAKKRKVLTKKRTSKRSKTEIPSQFSSSSSSSSSSSENTSSSSDS